MSMNHSPRIIALAVVLGLGSIACTTATPSAPAAPTCAQVRDFAGKVLDTDTDMSAFADVRPTDEQLSSLASLILRCATPAELDQIETAG